jgi:hypothetical protein
MPPPVAIPAIVSRRRSLGGLVTIGAGSGFGSTTGGLGSTGFGSIGWTLIGFRRLGIHRLGIRRLGVHRLRIHRLRIGRLRSDGRDRLDAEQRTERRELVRLVGGDRRRCVVDRAALLRAPHRDLEAGRLGIDGDDHELVDAERIDHLVAAGGVFGLAAADHLGRFPERDLAGRDRVGALLRQLDQRAVDLLPCLRVGFAFGVEDQHLALRSGHAGCRAQHRQNHQRAFHEPSFSSRLRI